MFHFEPHQTELLVTLSRVKLSSARINPFENLLSTSMRCHYPKHVRVVAPAHPGDASSHRRMAGPPPSFCANAAPELRFRAPTGLLKSCSRLRRPVRVKNQARPKWVSFSTFRFSACNYEQKWFHFGEASLRLHNRACVLDRPNSQREGVRTPGYATVGGRIRGALAHFAGPRGTSQLYCWNFLSALEHVANCGV